MGSASVNPESAARLEDFVNVLPGFRVGIRSQVVDDLSHDHHVEGVLFEGLVQCEHAPLLNVNIGCVSELGL